MFVDGTNNTGLNAGIGTGTTSITIGNGVGGALTGNLQEAGGMQGDQSSHFSALDGNQHTFWGI